MSAAGERRTDRGSGEMKKIPSLEETLQQVQRASALGDKVVSITRVRKQPTTAQKKQMLLTFFAEMQRVFQEPCQKG